VVEKRLILRNSCLGINGTEKVGKVAKELKVEKFEASND
jgi:hypothetical protein